MSWTLIEHQAVSGSSTTSVTLGSGGTIPQTYKTLKLLISFRGTSNFNDLYVTFNGSSTSYTNRYLLGNGASASSGSSGTTYVYAGVSDGTTQTASTFSSHEVTIPNYAGSTNKAVSVDGVAENNATTAYQTLNAGLWSNTAAITSITIKDSSTSTIIADTTFTLYGLA